MMAVWRPSQGKGMRRNKAVTANQSAKAPTIAASATAFTPRTVSVAGNQWLATNTAVTSSSKPVACHLARRRSLVRFQSPGMPFPSLLQPAYGRPPRQPWRQSSNCR